MILSNFKTGIRFIACNLAVFCCLYAQEGPLKLTVEQITFGDKHHFFGYIGQSLTIPWNADEKYIVAMESDFHDHLPDSSDAARIILLDVENKYKIEILDETRAWNIQQGTMLYWNPNAPYTQFFFNDRDRVTGKVFTVLYDIKERKRVKEYWFEDTPVGNSGVGSQGKYFAAINYARMEILRPVTGYIEAYDWTNLAKAPDNDGVWRVDIVTGEKKLLVTFKQLAAATNNSSSSFYINHTLWNRTNERLLFFARAAEDGKTKKVNEIFTVKFDGTELTRQQYIGGHPEWGVCDTVVGAIGQDQVLYDVAQHKVVGRIGESGTFANPGGDVSLSPNAKLFVNGNSSGDINKYHVFRMSDSAQAKSQDFSRGPYSSGKLRIDSAPCWNRHSNQILVSGWIDGARQMFIIHVAGAAINSTQSDF